MGVILVSIIVSVIPAIFLYKWLVKSKDNEKFKTLCKTFLKKGMSSVLIVILVSLVFSIIGRIINISNISPLLYEAYHEFIVLALSEELVKYLTFTSILKKTNYKYDYFDVVIFMSIVGLGFGIIENITLAINSGIIPALIKGIVLAHVGYGFIVGYFYSKSLKTGNKKYVILGFIISWLLHGLYDFGLSEELIALNDNLMFISLGLILVSIITIIMLIRYVKKEKRIQK